MPETLDICSARSFQHLKPYDIVYMTVTENTDDFVRWQWLNNRSDAGGEGFVRCVRSDEPLLIKADGLHQGLNNFEQLDIKYKCITGEWMIGIDSDFLIG